MKQVNVFIAFLLLLSIPTFSQEELAYNDTTYFIPHDDDFNLIMSASKGHLSNVKNLLIKIGIGVLYHQMKQ